MQDTYNFIAEKENSKGRLFDKWGLAELVDTIEEYAQQQVNDAKTEKEECTLHSVSESFNVFGKVILSKNVAIKKNLDGFKQFVINGEFIRTKNLYKKLSE